MTTTITLPVPPSTNELYRNAPGRGRVKTQRYATWFVAAGWSIKEQRPEKVPGRVKISMYAPENARRDLANHEKATTDLLVEMGIIDGDRCKVVREMHQYWHDGRDFRVVIEPVRDVISVAA